MKQAVGFRARVEGLAWGGAGVLHLDGMAVFMDFCAPGDLVEGRIEEVRGRWARAALVKVLEPSEARVEPFCALYGSCGGCSLQHIAYKTQLEEKKTMLRDAFSRIGRLSCPGDIPVAFGADREYRNRMRFHCGTAPGLKERRGNVIVPLTDCPVSDTGIRKALASGSFGAGSSSGASGTGAGGAGSSSKKSFTVYSRKNSFLVEGRQSRGTVEIAGKTLTLDAEFFFQSNGELLEALIPDLVEAAKSSDTSLPMADVFAGVGTFSAFLETLFPRLDLVEENPSALALASENCRRASRFFPLSDAAWAASSKERYGFMVLDPPRSGLSKSFTRFLSEKGPGLLAYVSCNPPTLSRDGGLLSKSYELVSLKAYDFYPHTPHIECLALFRRRSREP